MVERLPLTLLVVFVCVLVCLTCSFSAVVVDNDVEQQACSNSGGQRFKRPTKDSLGRACWEFLHTTAEGYPDNPSSLDRAQMTNLLEAVAYLYPCEVCRDHFQSYQSKYEPDVSSREGLVQWLCAAHNDVNRRNGKPQFPCSRHAERWTLGGGYF